MKAKFFIKFIMLCSHINSTECMQKPEDKDDAEVAEITQNLVRFGHIVKCMAENDPTLYPNLVSPNMPIMRPPILNFTPPPVPNCAPEAHCNICKLYMQRRPCGGYTRLHIAASRDDLDEINLVLKHGGKTWVDIVDKENQTALYKACLAGHENSVKLLLHYGANPNIPDCISYRTPLHIAVFKNYTQIIQLLIRHNADIFAQDYFYRTPLHVAIEQNRKDAVLILYTLYNNMDLQDGFHETFIEKAARIDPTLARMLEAYKLLLTTHTTYQNNNRELSKTIT